MTTEKTNKVADYHLIASWDSPLQVSVYSHIIASLLKFMYAPRAKTDRTGKTQPLPPPQPSLLRKTSLHFRVRMAVAS